MSGVTVGMAEQCPELQNGGMLQAPRDFHEYDCRRFAGGTCDCHAYVIVANLIREVRRLRVEGAALAYEVDVLGDRHDPVLPDSADGKCEDCGQLPDATVHRTARVICWEVADGEHLTQEVEVRGERV